MLFIKVASSFEVNNNVQESRDFFKLIPVQNWVGWVQATTFQIGMTLQWIL